MFLLCDNVDYRFDLVMQVLRQARRRGRDRRVGRSSVRRQGAQDQHGRRTSPEVRRAFPAFSYISYGGIFLIHFLIIFQSNFNVIFNVNCTLQYVGFQYLRYSYTSLNRYSCL